MSQSIENTTKTVLAGAVALSLTACANLPTVDPNTRVGQATEKLGAAGHKIGEVSSDLWVKAKHVFRLDGTDAYHGAEAVAKSSPVEMPGQYKDELDLALVQDEFNAGPGSNEEVVISAVNPQRAEVVGGEIIGSDEPLKQPVIEIIAMDESAQQGGQQNFGDELIIDEPAAGQNSVIEQVSMPKPAPGSNPGNFAVADLEYEVRANENLWDIAKRLTGDATNWQQLAALNSLDPNGTVYSGQTLQIPGDMLKADSEPALAAAKPLPEAPAAGTPEQSARLEVPTATVVETVSEIVVVDAALPAASTGPSTSFKVQAGETMWDLAKRTTGDATNWKNIAAANGMTPEQAALIKYGQSLEIPNELLKSQDATATAALSTPEPAKPLAETVEQAANSELVQAPVTNVAQNTAAPAADSKTIEILPAKFQSEPPVIKSEAEGTAADQEDSSNWVMVSGTYYPKAIYNDANFSATLLTRVSPGTKLQVSRAIGPWFEVKTDRGTGYVHSRDIK